MTRMFLPLLLFGGTATLVLTGSAVTGLSAGDAVGRNQAGEPRDDAAPAATIWATADSLMPAWGFYPLAQPYDETEPLGRWAAWKPSGSAGMLTWVARFPEQGTWQVWVRRYGGYGSVAVEVNEKPVTGGTGGARGGRYVWEHVGTATLAEGTHHVDLIVDRGMFDAVLFTTDATLAPQSDALPEPVSSPQLRALRTWRDDAPLRDAAGPHGFVIGAPRLFEEVLYDWLPKPESIADRVRLWGAANQYVNGTFALRNLEQPAEVRVSLDRLVGPLETVLEKEQIDLRVVHVRPRRQHLFRGRATMFVPELLLRDDRTELPPKGRQGGFGGGQCVAAIPAHQSRQFWLTVHVPAGSPPGLYRGEVRIDVSDTEDRKGRLPIELEVLPVDLEPAEGYYSIYHRSQPADPERSHYVPPERYLAELKDQVRHGLNAATLYGGFETLPLAREAGMSRAPCLMHWPGPGAHEQVEQAKRMGFDDLYYYGVDEPNTPEAIERCRAEAERRLEAGLHMMTAINSPRAQEATREVIDRPVYNIYVFSGRNNPAVMDARERGFRPISYCVTATAYPLWYRGLTGLYNTACGYLGSCPWSYQDVPDERLYEPERTIHRVTYPDESGLPIPTLAWEAHRAGIDDVRYLEALDRAIAFGEERLEQPDPPSGLKAALVRGREVRTSQFESIDGRWFEYLCSLQPGDLQQVRRELAEAVVALNAAVGDHKH